MSDDRGLRERFWRTFQDRGLATASSRCASCSTTRRQIARLVGVRVVGRAAHGDELRALGRGRRGDPRRDGRPLPVGRRGVHRRVRRRPRGPAEGDAFQPWDQFAGIDALTRSIGVDREAVRAYLTVDAVTDGLFRLAREVFGIRVEERAGGMGWHEDVRTLALIDDATGELLGTCLWDPWDRHGQDGGHGRLHGPHRGRPPDAGHDGAFPPAVTMLVTMFPRPADGRAHAHLGVGDAEVLFHEFGHVLDFTIGVAPLDRPRRRLVGDGLGRGPVVLDRLLGPCARGDRDLRTTSRDRAAGARQPSSRRWRSRRRSRTCPTCELPPAGSGRPRRPRAGAGRPRRGLAAGCRRHACSRTRSERSARTPCR